MRLERFFKPGKSQLWTSESSRFLNSIILGLILLYFDALKKISQIEIPGFGELFRQLSYQKIGTSTIQSRASAFLLNQTYIFCLPGSTSAVRDAWDDILFHQLDIRHKPCNFVEIMPRLQEHKLSRKKN